MRSTNKDLKDKNQFKNKNRFKNPKRFQKMKKNLEENLQKI